MSRVATRYFVVSFILIGFILYGRSLFNGFVGDDLGYINHPYIQQFQLLKFFQSGSADLGGASPTTGQFFRPLMLVVFAFIYKFFGNISFFYHFFQLSIHISNVVLLFFIFKKLIGHKWAYLLSFIFLVHPINIEAVSYISDMQDVLFVFFGLLAITILVYNLFKKGGLYIVSLLLFFSLLSKETGSAFIVVVLLYVFIFKRPILVKIIYGIGFATIAYALIRVGAAHIWFGKTPQTIMGGLYLTQRMTNMPEVIFYYLKTVLYPKDLIFAQTWAVIPTLSTFLLPLIVELGIVSFIAVFLGKLKKTKTKYFKIMLFFLGWIVVGLLFHIQIIPLEMTVADRWFYFPFIGVLGIIGVYLASIKNKKIETFLVSSMFILILLLGARSNVRLLDWENSQTLYKHDIGLTRSYLLDHSYGYELMQRGNLDGANSYLHESVSIFQTTNNTNSLGVYYYKKNNQKEAISWFRRSIQLGDNFLAYNNLAHLELQEKQYDEAAVTLEGAVKKFPQNDYLWFLLTLANYEKGDMQAALISSERAYALSQSQQNLYVVTRLRSGMPILINN